VNVSIADDSMKEELAGTTAVIVLIKNSKIYCVSMLFYFGED